MTIFQERIPHTLLANHSLVYKMIDTFNRIIADEMNGNKNFRIDYEVFALNFQNLHLDTLFGAFVHQIQSGIRVNIANIEFHESYVLLTIC